MAKKKQKKQKVSLKEKWMKIGASDMIMKVVMNQVARRSKYNPDTEFKMDESDLELPVEFFEEMVMFSFKQGFLTSRELMTIMGHKVKWIK